MDPRCYAIIEGEKEVVERLLLHQWGRGPFFFCTAPSSPFPDSSLSSFLSLGQSSSLDLLESVAPSLSLAPKPSLLALSNSEGNVPPSSPTTSISTSPPNELSATPP